MSANADYARAWVESWNRGDVEGLMRDVGPDAEWVVAREHPDATTHRGPEAVGSYLREWMKMMDLSVEIVELEERGDRVLTVVKLIGTGIGSGAETEVHTAMLTTFHDGAPTRIEEFLDPEEARRALESR